MSAHAERKLATVLFADLIGSTAAAEDQDPERTRARLERFYEAMAEEIEAAGGTVEKFVGDAVMAAFGAPGALEDHAERALHAALSMQRRLSSAFGGEPRTAVRRCDARQPRRRRGRSDRRGNRRSLRQAQVVSGALRLARSRHRPRRRGSSRPRD